MTDTEIRVFVVLALVVLVTPQAMAALCRRRTTPLPRWLARWEVVARWTMMATLVVVWVAMVATEGTSGRIWAREFWR